MSPARRIAARKHGGFRYLKPTLYVGQPEQQSRTASADAA
jgi:hypothetical protein